MILVHGHVFELWLNHKNGWNPEVFRERYNEVLDRYDYIVGDWGHNQLRLKGFFKTNHSKATKETSIASLQDYLFEYCNFGCAYFVLEKVQHKALAATEESKAGNVEEEANRDAHPDQYSGDDADDEDEDDELPLVKGNAGKSPDQQSGQAGNGSRSRNRRRNRNRNRNRNGSERNPSERNGSERNHNQRNHQERSHNDRNQNERN